MTQSDKCHALTFFTIKETRTRILESEQLVPEDVLNTAFREIDDVEQVENEEVENEVVDQSIVSRRPRITRYRTVAQIAEQLDNDENDISSNEDDDDYDWEIFAQKKYKTCFKITLCLVLNLFKTEKKVKIFKIRN